MWWQARSLRSQLNLFAAAIIAPIAIVAVVAAVILVQREKALLEARGFEVVRDAARLIDQELDKHIAAIETLAVSPAVAGGDLQKLYEAGQQIGARLQSAGLAIRDCEGRRLLTTLLPFGELPEAPVAPAVIAADRKAFETGKVVVSDVFRIRAGGMPAVAISKAVQIDGSPAIISLALSSERIRNVLPSRAIPSDWLFGVTGNDDRMIFRGWATEQYIGARPTPAFLQNTQGESGTFSAVTLEGVSVVNFYTRSKIAGWRVSVAIPASIVNAPYYQAMVAFGVAIALALLVSLAISAWYARRIIRPVRAIQMLSASPESAVVVERSGIAELDELSVAFQKHLLSLGQHEREQAVLMNELNHRVKNTLAIVQALALLARRRTTSLEQYQETFEGRLRTLARSHDLLSKTNWTDCDLALLIAQCLATFAHPSQIKIDGDPVRLTPAAAVKFCMILHELGTNAAKYGAFSKAEGHVAIDWKLEGGRFLMRWYEHVPGFQMPAGKPGFGSELIRLLIERDLGGELTMKAEPDGLHVVTMIPARNITVYLSPSCEDLRPAASPPRVHQRIPESV